MRVLRLDLGSGSVELHPYVTVVRGLTPAGRAELLDVFAGLPSGRSSVSGLVESHGVLLDLAPATLSLLDLRSDLDVVVRPADLPNRGPGDTPEVADARRAVAAAEAAAHDADAALSDAVRHRDAAHEALELASNRPPPTNESAARAHDAAALALADAELAADAAAADHEQLVRARQQAEQAVEAATAAREEASRAVSVAVAALEAANERRDATASAVVDAARRRLDDAESVLHAIRSGESAGLDPVAKASADALRVDRIGMEAALLALDTTDPLPIKLALQQLHTGGGNGMVPLPAAIELADEWAFLTTQLDRAGISEADDFPAAGDLRTAASERLEQAQLRVAQIESILRGPVLDPGDVAELERLHDQVTQARDAAGKRFGGARAEKRLEEAAAAEQEVLDRLGFLSWADYRLGAPAAAVASEEELAEQLISARMDLAEAEAEAKAIADGISAELARAELFERRRTLRRGAVALLGTDPGDDVEGALRRHRVSAASLGEHLQRLRQALEGAGMVLADEDVDERLLADLAKVWLAEQEETEAQRERLQVGIADIDVRLAEIEAAERSPVSGEPLAAAAGAVEDARSALAAAEARLSHDRDAASEVERLRAAFEAAARGEEEALAALAAADERRLVASDAERASVGRLERCRADIIAATDALAEAALAIEELERRVAEAREEGSGALEAELAEADAEVERASRALDDRHRELVVAREALVAAQADAKASPGADAGGDGAEADDVEWYLLARLAAQRSVSYAGSVPLVLDDALAGFTIDATRSVLDRLERMASTVQVVLVTEDLATAAWAEGLGHDRAHVAEV